MILYTNIFAQKTGREYQPYFEIKIPPPTLIVTPQFTRGSINQFHVLLIRKQLFWKFAKTLIISRSIQFQSVHICGFTDL